jgi:mannose-6-phosphate isomerase class I
MVFHLDFVSRVQHVSNITIRSNDTDVLIILLYHIANTEEKNQRMAGCWLKLKQRRLVNINNIVQNLTKDVALALPGLHALTGCDYVPAFFNKGKIKPFELMKKHSIFTQCMKALGNGEINDETSKQCSTFVCHLYGQPKEIDVNQARHMIFRKTYAPKTLEDPLDYIKCVNPSALPPCAATLQHQLERANYVAAIWKRAALQKPRALAMDGIWIATCIESTGIMAISCLQTYTKL